MACASSLSYCAKTRFRDLLRLSAIGPGSEWLSSADMDVSVVLAEHLDSPEAVRAWPVSDVAFDSMKPGVVHFSVAECAVGGRGAEMPMSAAFVNKLLMLVAASSGLRPKT